MLKSCCRSLCLRQQTIPFVSSQSSRYIPRQCFHASPSWAAVKPFILADIGEGIKEVQIIQWFVQPGARVEQFDKLCEVQSDKAATEITSRFDGVIKKLYYEADDTAQVGKPLCDIDIAGDIAPESEGLLAPTTAQAGEPSDAQQPQDVVEKFSDMETGTDTTTPANVQQRKHAFLATPAVRGLLKELDVKIEEVFGTGKDGRVVKNDVHKFAADRDSPRQLSKESTSRLPVIVDDGPQRETDLSLTPIQAQMFRVMTRSLAIPHFLFADEIDLSALSALRGRLNSLSSSSEKLSFLPFVIKAVSIALQEYPLLNAKVQTSSEDGIPPKLIMREKHNIGVAMDTPQGLLVPNIKNVANLSIRDIGQHLSRLQALAQASKLSALDLTGGTITVSNIGTIGGTYVSPVVVQSEVAILGMGKAKVVPAFDENGDIVKKTVGNFSWSADHRVIDGATMARMGERVRKLIEEPASMVVMLK